MRRFFLSKLMFCLLLLFVFLSNVTFAYNWPIKEFDVQHSVTGVLGEYRSTLPQDHFHKGVDIGALDRTPVYSIDTGLAYREGSTGVNAYIIVGNKAYVHLEDRIDDNPDGIGEPEGAPVTAGVTIIGRVLTGQRHVHLTEDGGASNPLRVGGLTPYVDTSRPSVSTLDFYRQGTETQLTGTIYKQVDILSRAWDAQSNGSSNVGIYRIGYQVQNQAGNIVLGPLYNIQFNSISDAILDLVYDTTKSNTSTYYYWVTNTMAENKYWNTRLRLGQQWNGEDARINSEANYQDGKYRVSTLAYDIKGNGGNLVSQEGAITVDTTIDNFRPYVQKVTIGDKYSREWTFDGTNLNSDKASIDKVLKADKYTITILFSEPVVNPTLSIDIFGTITLSSSEAVNNQKTFTGTLNVTADTTHPHDGQRTMTISARDLAGNQLLQLVSGATKIDPSTQLTRDTAGKMQGTGGKDTLHKFNIDATPPEVTAYTPKGNNIPPPTQVTATFSEKMDKESTEQAFSISASYGPVPSLSFDGWEDNKIIFNLTGTIVGKKGEPGPTYTVVINNQAKDLAGNSDGFVWIFSTWKNNDGDPYPDETDPDDDNDGLPDDWENKYTCKNPWVNDANEDEDKDGLTNANEFARGTDPCEPNFGSIAGKVIDGWDESPIKDANIKVTNDNITINTSTDEKGKYSIGGLKEGTYTVTASHKDYEKPETQQVFVIIDKEAEANFSLFKKPPPGWIYGHVRNSRTNAGIAGAEITCTGENVVVKTVSGETGSYKIQVEPGTYTLIATKDGYKPGITTATVIAGKSTEADIYLDPIGTGGIYGKVTDASSKAGINGALVEVFWMRTITGERGRYSFTGLPEGSYAMTASKEGYYDSGGSADVKMYENVKVNFELVPKSEDEDEEIIATDPTFISPPPTVVPVVIEEPLYFSFGTLSIPYFVFHKEVERTSTPTLNIFNSSGGLIRTIKGSSHLTGFYEDLIWDGKDDAGNIVSDGNYSYKVEIRDDLDNSNLRVENGGIIVDKIIPIASIQRIEYKQGENNVIQIYGTAIDNYLKNYKIEYVKVDPSAGSGQTSSGGESPTEWTIIWDSPPSGTVPIIEGILAKWDTSSLASGTYTIRLTVEDKAGNVNSVTKEFIIPSPPSGLRITVGDTTQEYISGAGEYMPDNASIWIDDDVPEGSTMIGEWQWDNNVKYSGMRSHTNVNTSGQNYHYFIKPKEPLTVNKGDNIIQYVYIDPSNVPKQIMLQFYTDSGDGEHRIFFGNNSIQTTGTLGSISLYHFGELPFVGKWLRLKIPASLVGLEGVAIKGIVYGVYDGKVWWDKTTTSRGDLDLIAGNYKIIESSGFDDYTSTKINYTLSKDANIELNIYDNSNNLVKRLVSEHQRSGNYTITWDSKDEAGNFVSDGIYHYQFRSNEPIDCEQVEQIAITGEPPLVPALTEVIDSNGNKYVIENNLVKKFDSSNNLVWTIEKEQLPQANNVFTPVGLGLDVNNNLYIADGVNNRVIKITTNGYVLTQYTQLDAEGIKIDEITGDIYISNQSGEVIKLAVGRGSIDMINLIAKIRIPEELSLVRSYLPIIGTASARNFKRFTVEYGKGKNPDTWTIINQSYSKSIDPYLEFKPGLTIFGNLGTLDTGKSEYGYMFGNEEGINGVYSIRLSVENIEGKKAEDKKTVIVGRLVLNSKGGEVYDEQRNINLIFEQLSLYEEIQLIAVIPAEDLNDITEIKPNGYKVIGKIYQFLPNAISFPKPANLEMKYTESEVFGLDEAKLGIYQYNPINKEWERCISEVDSVSNKVRTTVSYLRQDVNYYAILYDITSPILPVVFQPDSPTENQIITISGTAEVNTDVEIFSNNISQGTTLTDSNGIFTKIVILFKGNNIIYAVAKDKSGQRSLLSNTVEVIYQEQAPLSVSSVKFKTKDFLFDMPNVEVGKPLFIELTGTDKDVNRANSTTIILKSSITDPVGIKIQVVETGVNTGVYRGIAYVGRITQSETYTIGAKINNEIISAKSEVDISKEDSIKVIDITPSLGPFIYSSTHASVIQNTFEDGLSDWTNAGGDIGADVILDNTSATGKYSVKLVNKSKIGNFAVNILEKSFSLREFPILSFDYKIPEGLRFNFVINDGTDILKEIVFTGDKNRRIWEWVTYGYGKSIIETIGEIPDVIADNKWHYAEINLYNFFQKYYPDKTDFEIKRIGIGNWSGGGWIELRLGENELGASCNMDNFSIIQGGSNNPNPVFSWIAPYDDNDIIDYSYILDNIPDTNADEIGEGTNTLVSYTNLGSGKWYFHIRVKDKAGNWGLTNHYVIRIDTEGPIASEAYPQARTKAGVSLVKIKLKDSPGVGVASHTIKLSFNGIIYDMSSGGLSYDSNTETLSFQIGKVKQPTAISNGQLVEVSILEAYDLAGNSLQNQLTWSWIADFTTTAMADLQLLTTLGGETPAWSSDSKKIAFISERTGRKKLWVIDSDDLLEQRNSAKQITFGESIESNPCWSADGTKIVFSSSINGNKNLWLINSDGSDLKQITYGNKDDYPNWSFDSQRIVFSRGGSLWSINRDATNARAILTDEWHSLVEPNYSPDGTKIVYRNSLYNDTIWVVNADGRNPLQLTTTGYEFSPNWYADGSKIIFSSKLEDNVSTLWNMNSDGTNQGVFFSNDGKWIEESGRWNLEQSSLAFKSTRNGFANIWLMPVIQMKNVSATPTYFSPNADGIFDNIEFTYELSNNSSPVSLNIYDKDNRLVRAVIDHVLRNKGFNREIWDGKDNSGNVVQDDWYSYSLSAYGIGKSVGFQGRIMKDNTAPYSELNILGPQAIINGQNVVSSKTVFRISATDNKGSGVVSLKYSLDGAPWISGGVYTSFTVPTENKHNLQYRSFDYAGNWEYIRVLNFSVDNTSPTQPQDMVATQSEGMIVNLSWRPNTELDLAGYNVYRDGVKINPGLITNNFYKDIDVTAEDHTYTVTSLDKVENESIASAPITVIWDSIPPVTTLRGYDLNKKILSTKSDWEKGESTNINLETDDVRLSKVLTDYYVSGRQINIISYDVVPNNIGKFIVNEEKPGGTNISYKISYSDDGINYTVSNEIFNGSSIEAHKYVKIQIDLSTSDVSATPVIKSITLDYYGYKEMSEFIVNNTFYTNSGMLALFAEDVGSGVKATKYRIPGNEWKDFNIEKPIEIVESTSYPIEFYSIDNAGNTEQIKYFILHKDTTSPVSSINIKGPRYEKEEKIWISSETKIEILAEDSASGMKFTMYRINEAEWNYYQGEFSITGEPGKYQLEYYSEDNLGNREEKKILTLYLDNIAPVATLMKTFIDENGEVISSPAEIKDDTVVIISPYYLSLIAKDLPEQDNSGVKQINYRIDDGDLVNYNLQDIPSPITFPDYKTHYLSYYSTDNVDNKEVEHRVKVIQDFMPPQTEVFVGQPKYISDEDLYVSAVTAINFSSIDDLIVKGDRIGLGVGYVKYWIDNEEPIVVNNPEPGIAQIFNTPFFTLYGEIDGKHKIYYESTDIVGNKEEIKSISVILDSTKPVAKILSPSNEATGIEKYVNGVVTIVGTATDGHFDYYKLEYGVGENPQEWKSEGLSPNGDCPNQVIEGVVGTWDTSSLTSGTYTIRLTAVDKVLNTSIATVQVIIDVPKFLLSIADKLSHPDKITVDRDGYIYVADRENDCYKVLDHAGNFLAFGKEVLNKPEGIAIDSIGNVYVGNRNGNRVDKFDSSGKHITDYGGIGYLNKACGLRIDEGGEIGKIVVADRNNNCIRIISFDGYVNTIGYGILNKPEDVEISKDEKGETIYYVANRNEDNIKVFNNNGQLVQTINVLLKPDGIVLTKNKNIIVADSNNSRVVRIDKYGYIQLVLDGSNSGKRFNHPKGVSFDTLGNLYIADSMNKRIVIYGAELPKVPNLPTLEEVTIAVKKADEGNPKWMKQAMEREEKRKSHWSYEFMNKNGNGKSNGKNGNGKAEGGKKEDKKPIWKEVANNKQNGKWKHEKGFFSDEKPKVVYTYTVIKDKETGEVLWHSNFDKAIGTINLNELKQNKGKYRKDEKGKQGKSEENRKDKEDKENKENNKGGQGNNQGGNQGQGNQGNNSNQGNNGNNGNQGNNGNNNGNNGNNGQGKGKNK